MANPDEPWDDLFEKLTRLRDGWPSRAWSYDRRFKCVVATIPLASEAVILPVIAEALPTAWTSDTLAGAPADVRALGEACGGVRAAQRLYWGGRAVGVPGAFGLWWPWGDSVQVSLRIGLHDVDSPKDRYPRLRDIFGIPQAQASG